jgi:hypothetical protein
MPLFKKINNNIKRNIDDAFGIETKDVICHPIRANRGGGKIIGVLEMINKKNDLSFEDSDIDIMSDCARKISDELHIRFRELLQAAEILQGKSHYIGDRSSATGNKHRYDAPTQASKASQYEPKTLTKETLDSMFLPKFNINGPAEMEKDNERDRYNRRKSFGENKLI